MDKLRDEIIEFQKAIAEFHKWKLIGIGAIFALGLGFTDKPSANTTSSAVLALFAVPLLCAYADLLIRDRDVRICAIGSFMRNNANAGVYAEYEKYLLTVKGPKWVLGHAATWIASLGANIALLWLVLGAHIGQGQPAYVRTALVAGSISGSVTTLAIYLLYGRVIKAMYRQDFQSKPTVSVHLRQSP